MAGLMAEWSVCRARDRKVAGSTPGLAVAATLWRVVSSGSWSLVCPNDSPMCCVAVWPYAGSPRYNVRCGVRDIL